MNKFKKMLSYLLIIVLNFYLLPFLIKDTGTAMMILLVVMPAICFVSSIIYGMKNSFNLLFCILIVILYIPTIFIFYNISAWVYIIPYGIVVILGNAIGMFFYKKQIK